MKQPPMNQDCKWGENARLALDTIALKPTNGIPTWVLNLMVIPLLEEIAGHPPGSYAREPETVYLDFQVNSGVCAIDQWIPRNPLTMTEAGFGSGTERTATTGAGAIVLDGMAIDSPEAVVEHMERFAWPRIRQELAGIVIDEHQAAKYAVGKDGSREMDFSAGELVERERGIQGLFGRDMLKIPYDHPFQSLPLLHYGRYGYEHYFTAYALYPEMMEKDFSLQADLAAATNAISARAYLGGDLPRVLRLDHDMCDSRGTLVDIASLDELWFAHFARSVKPLLDAGVRLLWHCDGNVMDMAGRLIEAGVGGFQGFQYEDGVDYQALCKMTDRDGAPLMIMAGVSVTTTLPRGTPADVSSQLKWLVECGPPVGLFLAASSSIAPGTNAENVRTLIEGLKYYREHGRG